jgi:hypothetical protein
VTNSVVGRILDQFDIEHSLIKRWKDDSSADDTGLLLAAEETK